MKTVTRYLTQDQHLALYDELKSEGGADHKFRYINPKVYDLLNSQREITFIAHCRTPIKCAVIAMADIIVDNEEVTIIRVVV